MKKQPINSAAGHTFVYGVRGLTEWQAILYVGKARIRIPFTGGAVSGFGIVPATFTTTSFALARLIEKSDYYESGRIIRIE